MYEVEARGQLNSEAFFSDCSWWSWGKWSGSGWSCGWWGAPLRKHVINIRNREMSSRIQQSLNGNVPLRLRYACLSSTLTLKHSRCPCYLIKFTSCHYSDLCISTQYTVKAKELFKHFKHWLKLTTYSWVVISCHLRREQSSLCLDLLPYQCPGRLGWN